jgi:plastocyanin
MKTLRLLVLCSCTLASLGWMASTAQSQSNSGPAYLRSALGQPWGSPANENAMDRVFGVGQWRDLRFETVDVPALLAQSSLLFMDGSDMGAQNLEIFLTTHLPGIEGWVRDGGVLFLNAAPNVGDGMNFGFGVNLRYSDETISARADVASHAIFQGPFLPVGTTWTGSGFGHATVSGTNLTPLIVNTTHGRFVLGERRFGNGWVLFGGMTTDNHHSPQPEAQNLRANILAYANDQINASTNLPPEILRQPASQAVLVGQDVTLNPIARGSRPLHFQWLFNGEPLAGATNMSLTLNSVTTNQAGGYKLIASNALGVATSERATLTVSLQGPHITVHPASLSVLAGEDVILFVQATGGPLFYQWRFNGMDLPGATNATLFLAAVTASQSGSYYVAVSNLLGYVTSQPATLAVNQFAPRIVSQPSDVTAQKGDSVQFFVGVEAAPPPAYQWRFLPGGPISNGVNLPGETNANLLFSSVATNQAGGYFVVATNQAGSVTSRVARLIVNQFPPSITSQPFNQTVAAGSDVAFFVGVTGSPPLSFQWRHNGTNIPGATNATLFLSAVHPNRAGLYTVAVSNYLGFAISLPAVLTVLGGAAPVIVSQPANFTVLAGGNATLIVNASGQPAPTYQWRFNDVDLPGATLSTLTLTSMTTNQAGNYTVLASNLLGSVTSRVAVVTVNLQAPMISTQPASRTIDAGGTVTFSVVASGGPPPSYQWLFNGEALPGATSSSLVLNSVHTNQAGIYSVIVSNELGVVPSAPATLTVNGAAPIITTQPASRTVLDGSNATFTVSATGIPQVTYQWRLNGIGLPGRTSSTLVLTNVSTNAAGEYTVVVSNLLGAVVSAPAILTVTQQAPVITAQTTNRTAVVGANVIFQVLAVAGPRPTYQWQRDGVNISGANNAGIILTNVSRADEGNYVVVVSNPLGSVTSQPMRLTVVYQPPVITGNPTNRSVLAGGTASFTVTATGSAPLFYQWRFNGTDLPGATSQTLVLTGVMTNQAGGYSCLVTNFGGERISGVATLTVTVQGPVITTQPANRTVSGGTNVTFAVVATGAPPPTYQWLYNGASLAGATAPQLVLVNVGTNHAGGYSVVVSNLVGSITSRVASLTVIVQPTVITVQPPDRTVRPGGSVTFAVSVTGTPPLLYQWDYNGEDIAGATNATLTLSNVTLDNEGSYRVTISGAGGTVVSRKAELTVREPEAGDFRITALLTTNSRRVEHNFVTGDDRGGIAVSSTRVFYSGDSQTAGFDLADLSGGAGVGRVFDALVSDLNSGTVYSLGNGTAPLGGGGVVTTLIELDGTTGQPTANVITLSQSITMQGGSGLFAGYDQIALFSGARVYSIEVSSGLVIDHGPFTMPPHATCENWAFWGVAEQLDGELHLAYVRHSQAIERVRVSDGFVEPIAIFANLSDMCSFTLSLALDRWYFHHEGTSQFGGSDESIGYADATWEVTLPGPPIIRQQPQSITALAGYEARFTVSANGAQPLSYQWRFNDADVPGATSPTLLLSSVTTNNAGGYSVVVVNTLGAVTSQVATLTVEFLAPSIITQPFGRSAFEGAQVRFSVIATGAPPPSYQWQFNGTDIAGATNPVLTLAQVSTNDAGNYRVRVSNPLGVITSDTVILLIRPGTNVITALLIWDELNPNTLSLRDALDAAGIEVQLSATSEIGYDGTNPSLEGFDAVIHLNGTTYSAEMPTAGQDALVQFVRDGGGFLQAEWNSYEISQGRMLRMRDLTLFDRVDAYQGGDNTWVVVPEQADHPVVANVPSSFTFRTDFHFGPAHVFASDPVTVLMRDPQGHDALAVREFGLGRIVGFQHAGNYDLGPPPPYRTLANPNIQQLYIDGVVWAAVGGTLNLPPSITTPPANRTVGLGRTATFHVAARGTRPLSYQWRFNGTALSGATNDTLTITNVALNQAGEYAVVVSNPFGSIVSAPAILTISEMAIVGVFDDPAYVDTSGGLGAESDTLQASLQLLGYGVSTFTNITVAASENLVLMFPELERGYLPGDLDEGTRAALDEYVESGGSVILHGVPDAPSWASDLLNVVFGFNVQAYQEASGTLFARTPQASSTAFAGNADILPANYGSSSFDRGSLPPGSLSVYEDAGRTLVAVLPHGVGRIIFLGWDWNNAIPLGTDDNGWLDVLNSALIEAGSPSPGTNRPPVIAVQPDNRTVLAAGTVTFQVVAGGSQPLAYQWQFNGFPLPNATNSILTLANVSLDQSGDYTALVSNPFGVASSLPAFLSVVDAPPNAPFRIVSLTPNNSAVVEHNFLTDDDRGGIAASGSQVFYTGDGSTARFGLGDLSGGVSLAGRYDAMVSNLRTETVYSLGNGTTPIPHGGGIVTTLIEIDGESGELTANTITLSQPINVSEEAGIFSGYDQVVLLSEGRAFNIHLPTGLVTALGVMAMPDHQGCENWAFWGVAENFDGAAHVVYVRDSQTIVRARVPDGATEVVATFDHLSDMCSFTISLSLNRWYFHHEGGSQFGGTEETVGFADAVWEFPVPPVPPAITQAPQDVNGLWGGAAMFHVTASGSLLSYQWFFDGAAIPGATASTLLLSNLSSSDAGHYTVSIRNPFGSVSSAPVTLTVSTLPPAITRPPSSQSVVLGADVLFSAEISGAPAPVLQWFFNNTALSGATNATLLLTNVTMSAAGAYRIVADSFAGSAISPVATLTVIPQVPLPVALDTPALEWMTGGDALWTGQPFTTHDGVDAAESGFLFDDEQSWLQTTVTGPGQVRFWWKVSSEVGFDFLQLSIDGVEQRRISGDVNWQQQTVNLPSGLRTLRWSYHKDGSVADGQDRAWLDEVRIEIAPRILTQPLSRTAVEGGTATFAVVAEGSAPLSYQWRKNGALIPQATNASLVLTNVRMEDNGGIFSVVVANPHGSVTSSNASLAVVPSKPVVVGISIGGQNEERNAFAATLTNLGFVVRFISQGQWAGIDVVASYPGGGMGPNTFEISSGVNYVQISDHGSGWTPNSVRPITEGASIIVSVSSAHPITSGLPASWTTRGFWRYGYLPEDYVGWSIDTTLPSLVSESGAANQPRLLVANSLGSGRAAYVGWNVYGPDAGPNDLTILRNTLSWVAKVSVAPAPPVIVEPPASRTVDAGSAVAFQVVAGGSPPLSYQWQFNGAAIPGATNETFELDYALPVHAGEYTVVVSNPFGTVTSAPATLAVITQAPHITTQPASQTVLGGGSAVLTVTATGVPAPAYQWKRDGVDVPGATNATLVLNNVSPADTGNYKVVVRNLAGAVTSLPAHLAVNIIAPQITLQPASQAVLRGTNVTFTVAATGAPMPTYQWRFNDLDLAGETGASLTIRQTSATNAGNYTVRVSNSGGTATSVVAVLSVVEFISLPDALDMAGLVWRTGGAAPWFGQPMISRDGFDAAGSGGTGDNQSSWLETTVTGPGTVSFAWKVSSELGFDQLRFSIGNSSQAAVSGETDWQTRSFNLPEGQQTLRWVYAKDGSARDGADAGWVDQVVVTTTSPLVLSAVIVGADVRLRFPSAPGRHYRVERASGLTPSIEWQPVTNAENVVGTGSTLEVLDAGGAGYAQRFYRVTLLP